MTASVRPTTSDFPLLATKFYCPQWSADLVSRPRLIDLINPQRKLTLVSAPAGFGKTTLLAEWVTSFPLRPIAWVSLDTSDNDQTVFWTYLITALQNIHPSIGTRSLSLLQSPQPPPIESVLMTLLNEATAVEAEVVLILDDYHAIETETIHHGIGFLLSHLPPQMHLIIASRADPPLALARLRSYGDLTELRVSDLRFTPEEAAAFLNQVMGLTISAADVAALEKRTEGWIAGLQLAALSMQRREDLSGFITAFSGDDRYIVDYLLEEVLQRQPERVRHFLLQTAILERLTSDLCDAVTHQTDGQAMLETLERGNLFIIPLDNQRQWYRYHHLFADVLQAHALTESPARIPHLHKRASAWYEQHDLYAEAIRHALAAPDFERAAGLIEQVWPTMRRRQRETTVFGWITSLPDALIRHRPVLSVVYALVLLNDGQLDAAESRLQDAERCLAVIADSTESLAVVVTDEAQLQSLPASIANARAYRATALRDVPSTVTYAQQALALLPADEEYERGTTVALLGLAYWTDGKPEAGYDSFAEGLAIFKHMGLPQIAIGGTLILAQMSLAQGRLHRTIQICEQSLQLAAEQGDPVLPGTPELYLALSEAYYEQGDLAAASQLWQSGETLRQQASLSGAKFLWRVVQARLTAAEGNVETALDQLHQAEQLYYKAPMPVPNVRPIAALRARLWLRQERLTEALNWVSDSTLSVDDELSYLQEYEHLTLAQILIAQYRRDGTDALMHQALELLTRLLAAAEAQERTGSIIEILVVQALAYEAKADLTGAIPTLERALTLAEPEGYVRLFAECGAPMVRLLQAIKTRNITPAYTQRLLTAAASWGQQSKAPFSNPVPLSLSKGSAPPSLIEPLSQRELEVLRLLNTELSGPEIARELVVALSTVRTHTKRIYSKLNVTNRRAAVKRAIELDLI
ncbi:helix-turn-helix transcriptional regulator [Nodosilinea sp. LEGE 07088]|uniref:LuxR C-terminal-related transcriptional regulator n=1 Tax=Nodosilinea sp. LEGE 07088 TaxID=2777968 RepID=UPI001880AF33|nr:LuxR C-terminal-related transcriptional regulator [Nodosilinea sp. LEGE 07088]MBE9140381.1 helix-turn-helix transcriptional regulator [Nodosilinea sp. LEGE 07088]